MNFTYPYGATPLDADEIEGLIPIHISTQLELNEWEQANIFAAEASINKHQYSSIKILEVDFIKQIHFKMFNKTWKWAGQFRRTNKNIGVDWPLISTHFKQLLDDCKYQIIHKTYSIDEIAARFHHRLVALHLFPNGNERHARLTTDILLMSESHSRFTWGQNSVNRIEETRKHYIEALRAADNHDYKFLMDFIRQ